MKTKKIISLSLLTLAICSVAVASEYQAPNVEFRVRAMKKTEMRAADTENYYHYEGPAKSTDRQIASEEEVKSDREPSSVIAKPKKPEAEKVEPQADEPQPWMRRIKHAEEFGSH